MTTAQKLGVMRDVKIQANSVVFVDDIEITSVGYWDAVSPRGYRFWYVKVEGIAVREQLPVQINIPIPTKKWALETGVRVPEHLQDGDK